MICVLDFRKDLEEKLKPQEVWCRKIFNFNAYPHYTFLISIYKLFTLHFKALNN